MGRSGMVWHSPGKKRSARGRSGLVWRLPWTHSLTWTFAEGGQSGVGLVWFGLALTWEEGGQPEGRMVCFGAYLGRGRPAME
jgi:hypothetical protein